METSKGSWPTGDPPPSRRRSARIEVLGQLHGQLAPLNVPLVVHDIGLGGFQVESPISFPRGAVHKFRFTSASGIRVIVAATAMHSRKVEGREAVYLSGFEFVRDQAGETDRAVAVLLDSVSTALTH